MYAWLLLGLCAAAADAPDKDVSWKAQTEIARRGAMAEHVEGFASDAQPAIGEILAPPADDSNKWHLTLVTMRGCQHCEKLRADFESSAALKAWVDTSDYKKSWAHWQVVQIEDKSQEWRWVHYRPKSFPALILQPPFDRSWGDPHTIVFLREGYDGRPEKLAAEIRAAMIKYAKTVQPQRSAWKRENAARLARSESGGHRQAADAGGWTPPVLPPSPLSPPSVQPAPSSYPPPDPTSGPDETLAVAGLLLKIAALLFPSASTWLLLLTAGSNVWMLYREIAHKSGIRTLLSDDQAQAVVEALKSVGPSPTPPKP